MSIICQTKVASINNLSSKLLFQTSNRMSKYDHKIGRFETGLYRGQFMHLQFAVHNSIQQGLKNIGSMGAVLPGR